MGGVKSISMHIYITTGGSGNSNRAVHFLEDYFFMR